MNNPKTTRRAFLQAGAVAAVSLPSLAAAQERSQPAAQPAQPAQPATEPVRDTFGGFLIGIQSYSFRNFNLEQTLQRIADLGIRYVELYNGHLPLNSTDAQINAARALCFRHNITPIAFGVEGFTNNHAANRLKFEFARKLGVRYLSADPTPDSFTSLSSLAAEFGIGIGIHPHGPSGRDLHRWWSTEQILPAVRNQHRLIGTCLDTGHLIRSAQNPFNRRLDPAAEIRAMGPRNFGLHLKDHDNERRVDVVYGRGVLNVENVIRALREVNFQGYISIEYEANPANPSDDIRACLDVFRQTITRIG
jgi:inosose dehydratase